MKEEISRNNAFYEKLLDRHGYSHKSLDWGSKESQICRFKVIKEVGIQDNDTLLDVGCGLADLYEWLVVNKTFVDYAGIDISSQMIKAAQRRYPNLELSVGSIFDIEKTYDYIISSGIFVFRENRPLTYMITSAKKMFQHADKGVAFNSLSTWAKKDIDNQEFHADPAETLALISKQITNNLVLRHDYKSNDFTIYLYK